MRETEIIVKLRRYNPEVDTEPHWESYTVLAQPTDRILDALHKIKWEQDGTLTFRRSCAHGICGSDAMRINGVNRLACKTLVKDLDAFTQLGDGSMGPGKPITVEPIKGLPVLKDLVVDMEPFFDAYRSVLPFLMTTGAEPTRERLQSPADRARFDDTACGRLASIVRRAAQGVQSLPHMFRASPERSADLLERFDALEAGLLATDG